MALPTTITGISMAIACAGPYKIALDKSVETSTDGTSSSIIMGDSQARTWLAQNITVGASGITLKRVKAYLKKIGTPVDAFITCHIYAVDGNGHATGSSLGSASIAGGSSVTTSLVQYEWAFSGGVSLSANTTYSLAFIRSSPNNGSSYYALGGPGSAPYSSGICYAWDNSTTFADEANDLACVVLASSSGAGDSSEFYFFGRDSTTATTLQAYKATDPTSSFSSIKTQTVDAGNGRSLQSLAAYQVSDVIHLLAFNYTDASPTTCSLYYYAFDMSSDSFSITGEVILNNFNPTTSASAAVKGCSVIVRSGGEVVAHFNGARVASMGNSYAQTYYSRRTGTNTWSAATQVSGGGTNNWGIPEAILGASDAVHLFHAHLDATLDFTQRTLNSSNSLQTVSTAITTSNLTNGLQGVSYDSSGTQKIVCGYADSGGTGGAARFDSANTPTISTATVEASNSRPIRIFVDTGDSNKVWALYRFASDNDLYTEFSTDDGATWGTKTSAMSAAVQDSENNLSIDGAIYQRGNDVVIPYVVNDNGTLKYNEYVVRTITIFDKMGWEAQGAQFVHQPTNRAVGGVGPQ